MNKTVHLSIPVWTRQRRSRDGWKTCEKQIWIQGRSMPTRFTHLRSLECRQERQETNHEQESHHRSWWWCDSNFNEWVAIFCTKTTFHDSLHLRFYVENNLSKGAWRTEGKLHSYKRFTIRSWTQLCQYKVLQRKECRFDNRVQSSNSWIVSRLEIWYPNHS